MCIDSQQQNAFVFCIAASLFYYGMFFKSAAFTHKKRHGIIKTVLLGSSAALAGSFAPILQFEKLKIHIQYPCVFLALT